MSYFNYRRRKSSVVTIGSVPLGGDNPVRIQSMTKTSTLNTDASVAQCIRIVDAGADYVRLTAQGIREAENLKEIKSRLLEKKITTPLVADIHFNPKAAETAALYVEKVRINPGNFVDTARKFRHIDYTDREYAAELQKLKERFIPFLRICRRNGTAIRLGVNHGSLSDRIMSRYGDTPEGMVESCLEFLRICREENFLDVVISIKASNTTVMVRTVRLLIDAMEKENMCFPLHLGVTEAGDSEDGRIKSAVGTGALLADGIGDTIRVSLSEDPEKEIPVARKLVDYITGRTNHPYIPGQLASEYDFLKTFRRSATQTDSKIGGSKPPVVIAEGIPSGAFRAGTPNPDFLYIGTCNPDLYPDNIPLISDWGSGYRQPNVYPLLKPADLSGFTATGNRLKFLELSYPQLDDEILKRFHNEGGWVAVLTSAHINPVGEERAFFHRLLTAGCTVPVIIKNRYAENEEENLQIKAGADFGALLLDGFGDGIWLDNTGCIAPEKITGYMFSILQAARLRTTKTEYISCPGCGRTLFDLQTTIARVKSATSHLKGLKIGIMGCIVNGPGEMADADYGYVGAGKGKISLYKNKECIERNIPETEAVEKLVDLIKLYGDWHEPGEIN